jgi:hypothetical protein
MFNKRKKELIELTKRITLLELDKPFKEGSKINNDLIFRSYHCDFVDKGSVIYDLRLGSRIVSYSYYEISGLVYNVKENRDTIYKLDELKKLKNGI